MPDEALAMPVNLNKTRGDRIFAPFWKKQNSNVIAKSPDSCDQGWLPNKE
jgi:hypothetical protein